MHSHILPPLRHLKSVLAASTVLISGLCAVQAESNPATSEAAPTEAPAEFPVTPACPSSFETRALGVDDPPPEIPDTFLQDQVLLATPHVRPQFVQKLILDDAGERRSIRDGLKTYVPFPDGTTAAWHPASHRLIVRNSRENLDLLDEILTQQDAFLPATEANAAREFAVQNLLTNPDSNVEMWTWTHENLDPILETWTQTLESRFPALQVISEPETMSVRGNPTEVRRARLMTSGMLRQHNHRPFMTMQFAVLDDDFQVPDEDISLPKTDGSIQILDVLPAADRTAWTEQISASYDGLVLEESTAICQPDIPISLLEKSISLRSRIGEDGFTLRLDFAISGGANHLKTHIWNQETMVIQIREPNAATLILLLSGSIVPAETADLNLTQNKP